MSETYTIRRACAAAGLALLGSGALGACSSEAPDYQGVGNEFVVRGIVSDSEEDGLVQVSEEDLVVLETAGRADTWFAEGDGQEFLGDEFNFLQTYGEESESWWKCADEVEVGEVFDVNGQEIEPEQLQPGDVVEIQGRIHDSTDRRGKRCREEELAVYDTITVVNGPLHQ